MPIWKSRSRVLCLKISKRLRCTHHLILVKIANVVVCRDVSLLLEIKCPKRLPQTITIILIYSEVVVLSGNAVEWAVYPIKVAILRL